MNIKHNKQRYGEHNIVLPQLKEIPLSSKAVQYNLARYIGRHHITNRIRTILLSYTQTSTATHQLVKDYYQELDMSPNKRSQTELAVAIYKYYIHFKHNQQLYHESLELILPCLVYRVLLRLRQYVLKKRIERKMYPSVYNYHCNRAYELIPLPTSMTLPKSKQLGYKLTEWCIDMREY